MRASAIDDPISSAIPDDVQLVPLVAFAAAIGVGERKVEWLL
jgi:hypothetical protein